MFLHFRSDFTVLDVICKFAFYIRYDGDGQGRNGEFDFLALAVLSDDVTAFSVFFIVKPGNGLIKCIDHRLADSRIQIRGCDQDIIISADVTDKIIFIPVFGNRFTDNAGGGLNDIVALGVPVMIVVSFKIVDIHQTKGYGCLGGDALFHYIFNRNAPGQPGQGAGVQIHFFKLFVALGHDDKRLGQITQLIFVADIGPMIKLALGDHAGGVFQFF